MVLLKTKLSKKQVKFMKIFKKYNIYMNNKFDTHIIH